MRLRGIRRRRRRRGRRRRGEKKKKKKKKKKRKKRGEVHQKKNFNAKDKFRKGYLERLTGRRLEIEEDEAKSYSAFRKEKMLSRVF